MAFEAATFPSFPMVHDFGRQTIYPVITRTNGTVEWRGTHVRFEKFRWTIPTQTMTVPQKEAIRDFLVQRNHGLSSFRFRDPQLPSLTNAILGYRSPGWDLYLPFSSSVPGNLHPIWNPIISELTFTRNGVSVSPSNVSFAITGGIPQVTIVGSSSGDTIRVSGPIYFTAKLMSPLSQTLAALDHCGGTNNPYIYNVNAIELMEVHGEY
jgi:hypothetical protein